MSRKQTAEISATHCEKLKFVVHFKRNERKQAGNSSA